MSEGRIALMWGLMSSRERAAAVGVMGLGWLGGAVAGAAAEQMGAKKVKTAEWARAGASVAFFMMELAREK